MTARAAASDRLAWRAPTCYIVEKHASAGYAPGSWRFGVCRDPPYDALKGRVPFNERACSQTGSHPIEKAKAAFGTTLDTLALPLAPMRAEHTFA